MASHVKKMQYVPTKLTASKIQLRAHRRLSADGVGGRVRTNRHPSVPFPYEKAYRLTWPRESGHVTYTELDRRDE